MRLEEILQREEESFSALMRSAPALLGTQLQLAQTASLNELDALTQATITLCGLLSETLQVRVHLLETLTQLQWPEKPEGLSERLAHERRHLNSADAARRVRCLEVIAEALRDDRAPPAKDWDDLGWDALYRTALIRQLREERPQLLRWARDALAILSLAAAELPSLSLEEAQLAIEANRTEERAHFKRIHAELHVLTVPLDPSMTREQFLVWCRSLSALSHSSGKITSLRADVPALLLLIATEEMSRTNLLTLSTTMGSAQVYWARRYEETLFFVDGVLSAERTDLSEAEREQASAIQREVRQLVLWLQGDDAFWFTIDGVLAGGDVM